MNLTERESEIRALILKGLSNKEIGARLYLSQSTVKCHIKSLYRKVGRDGIPIIKVLRERLHGAA